MHVGLYLTGAADSTHEDLLAQAEEAERVGFDSVWLRERHFHPDHEGRNFFASPFLAAAFITSRTSRIRVGIGARGLPLLIAAAQSRGVVAETQETYRGLLADAGFEAGDVVCPVNRFVYVAETNAEAERDMRETLMGFIHRDGSVIRDFLKLPA